MKNYVKTVKIRFRPKDLGYFFIIPKKMFLKKENLLYSIPRHKDSQTPKIPKL